MENEEEMKEVKQQIKTIQAIFGKYSSERWDSLRHTSSFEQEVEPEFHRFGPYSFDQLVSKESKLQEEKSKLLDEKLILEERQNKLLDKENLLLQKSLPGIKPFHFFTINDI
jgi:hypothetical protein